MVGVNRKELKAKVTWFVESYNSLSRQFPLIKS